MSRRIDRLWVFVAQTPGEDEGIIAERSGGNWFPFVTASEAGLATLRERVKALPIAPGTTVRLVRFEVRTDLEFVRGPQ